MKIEVGKEKRNSPCDGDLKGDEFYSHTAKMRRHWGISNARPNVRPYLNPYTRYALLIFLYLELGFYTRGLLYTSANIIVDEELSRELFEIFKAEDPIHFGSRFDGTLKVAITLPDLRHIKPHGNNNADLPSNRRLVKRQAPDLEQQQLLNDLRYKRYNYSNTEPEIFTFQPDINQNSHSYSMFRRREPLAFRKELEVRRRSWNHGRKIVRSKTEGSKLVMKNGEEGEFIHPAQHNVHIKAFDKSFNISLSRNDKLLGPNFIYTIRNGSHVKTLPVRVPSCYYRGYLQNPIESVNSLGTLAQNQRQGIDAAERAETEASYAALSTCNGALRGYIRSHDGSHYFIHPISPNVARRVRRSIVESRGKAVDINGTLISSEFNNKTGKYPSNMLPGIFETREKVHRLMESSQDTHIVVELKGGGNNPNLPFKEHYCPLDHLYEHHAHIIDPLSVYQNKILNKSRLKDHAAEHIENKIRRKREPARAEVLRDATVEIGLFYDEDLYTQTQVIENREEKIMDYVLNIMNAVGLLLTHPSLGKSLDASLVRLEIFEKQPDTLKTKDATALLEAFREFQMDSNPVYEYGNRKNWDNAILLTGMNMYQNIYSNGQLKKVQSIAGLAGIGTMCHNKFSASIIEAKGYRSAYSIAHEMGHNFGMVHDGVSYASRCENEGFIMSPHTGMGTNKWSECSREIISDTLKYFTCLYETSDTPWKLTFPVQNVLPGQRISADQQCEAFVGKGSKRFKGTQIESICYYLWCTQPNNDYFAYGTHPALDGTYCGWNKWCSGGVCQPWPLNHGSELVQGGWTTWAADSGCTYNCMVEGSGIYVWTRKCENPIPLNGGEECVGEKTEYEVCDPTGTIAQRCEKVTVQQYIDDTCQKKSSRTSPYLGGSQYAHNTKVPTHACHVYCQRSDTGEYVPSGLLPDGSLCHIDDNDTNYYCVYGRCKKPLNNAQELPY